MPSNTGRSYRVLTYRTVRMTIGDGYSPNGGLSLPRSLRTGEKEFPQRVLSAHGRDRYVGVMSLHHEATEVARGLVAPGKGILAIDESIATCNKRFAVLGIPETVESRRAYRELLVRAPGLSTSVSGAILYDETIRQDCADGVPIPKVMEAAGLRVGIKVDTGAHPLAGHPGETVTEGLDGLRERLQQYRQLGATFAKWRAVVTIDRDSLPSRAAIEANCHALARYAALCQEAGIAPIVEPEVLMDGDHSLARCESVTRWVMSELFHQLAINSVDLAGIVLKPSMVIAGSECEYHATVDEVAAATVAVLDDVVPASIPGIAFLSGGQSDADATAHLARINEIEARGPWALTFSYGRALQREALSTWAGERNNVPAAQDALLRRVGETAAGIRHPRMSGQI